MSNIILNFFNLVSKKDYQILNVQYDIERERSKELSLSNMAYSNKLQKRDSQLEGAEAELGALQKLLMSYKKAGHCLYFINFWFAVASKDKNRIIYDAYQDGVRRPRRCSTFLNITSEEEKAFSEISKKFLGGITFDKVDDLVWALNYKIDAFPVTYTSDEAQWGITEYWESPSELLHFYDAGRIKGDCDTLALFKYHVINTAIKEHFDGSENRLRCAVVKFYGHTIELHMNLVWARAEPVNDWVFLESTIHKDRAGTYWGCPVRHVPNYAVQYTFDSDSEYKRLYQ